MFFIFKFIYKRPLGLKSHTPVYSFSSMFRGRKFFKIHGILYPVVTQAKNQEMTIIVVVVVEVEWRALLYAHFLCRSACRTRTDIN